MPYPVNKIVADSDRHAQVTNKLKIAMERQSLQANKRRTLPPRWKIGQKVMLSSENINLPNVHKKMKPRWLGPFLITQVNYRHNNYTLCKWVVWEVLSKGELLPHEVILRGYY